ncbi:MAG: ABC transporter permease subunit [Coriobacteriia bacterium]|nr:ABC transporter permease subunit [Coriobacteriia bacterium]
MNIFVREMKSHRKALFFWSLGMFALVASGMAKYAAYEAAGQSVNEILNALPKTVQIVFGMSGFDLGTASGFFGVLFLYIALMGAVHAALLGSDLIAKEERDKTSEFLFAKPISRSKVVTSKLSAGLVNVVVFNVVTTASSLYFVDYFNKGGSITRDVLVLMAGLFFLQMIFFSIGAVAGGISRKPKAAASIATSVLFLTFLLSYLVNMSDKLDILGYFTPFKYFDALTLLTDGRLDPVYVVLSAAIVVLSIAGTYRFYDRRDLSV